MSDNQHFGLQLFSIVHAFLADFSKGGFLPDRTYLINLGFIFILVIQITSAVVYQLLSMATGRSKRGVGGNITESLSFKACFVYYSIFLILKMINPSMYPVHWLTLLGRECSVYMHASVCACIHNYYYAILCLQCAYNVTCYCNLGTLNFNTSPIIIVMQSCSQWTV